MVEKARKLPTFYDICVRVKGHDERERGASAFESIGWRRTTKRARLRDFPSLTEARGGPMFLHNSLQSEAEVPGKERLDGLCVMTGKSASVVAVFSPRSAGCSRQLRKCDFDFVGFVARLM
jgi:hypothetical protein